MNLIYTTVYATAHYFIQTLNHQGVRGVRPKIIFYHEKYLIEPRVHVCFERNNLDPLRDRNADSSSYSGRSVVYRMWFSN